ncbi:NADPH-dependent FMN reductase [Bacillus sp. AFS088145]|uniref:NADPH-dependent FMN reductase n=1 Tax=Bacillus sp. AFS088145 TaxID=2033514 RepID=UPI000BFA8EA3|nr:NADPH-dependent FMN reductase [Bacillus sp. AFS088145]PFH89078.1 FMN reductase (NADPH) [Bacillus sp. AFS088145]
MKDIVIISASSSPNSRLNGILQFVKEKWVKEGKNVCEVNVGDLPPESLIKSDFNNEKIKEALNKIENSIAVVIAGPVYKASYSGVLKTFLDLIPQSGLRNKVVLPIFIGGTIAHLLSLEYALKPVLSVLGGNHFVSSVYAIDDWVIRDDQNHFSLSNELVERLNKATEELSEELIWLAVRP